MQSLMTHYSLVGTIEEASAAEVRALYQTNIFGHFPSFKRPCRATAKAGRGAYPRCIERARSCDDAIDRLLLFLKMGIRGDSRKPGH
jgi:hypothetical protein